MEFREVIEVSGVILGSIGGGAAIIFGFSNWLGKVWANRLMVEEKAKFSRDLESLKSELVRENESHKIKLKKSEFIFEKEFKAVSELAVLIKGILPPFRHQDMDWGEACDEIAQNFASIHKVIDNFLSLHGPVLGQDVKVLLSEAGVLATHHQFDVTSIGDVPSDANKAADELYKKLLESEKILLAKVHGQAIT